MRTPSLLAAVVASAAALAPVRSSAQVVNNWTFTTPALWTSRSVASAANGVDAVVFDVTAANVPLTQLTRMRFQVNGSARNGDLTNFRLVYYPNGATGSGYVVGTNTGNSWAPAGIAPSTVSIDLASPIALQGNYAGTFALFVDVNGAPASSFQTRLQAVTVNVGGVERYVMETEDLPLQGDLVTLN
jgi:hypothetical protein